MLLEMFATTEKMFMAVARNVIWVKETAAESAAVGHLSIERKSKPKTQTMSYVHFNFRPVRD